MKLLQGRPGDKYPIWSYQYQEYVLWSGKGPAIAQVPRYAAILDADSLGARELVASWDLPLHFATRTYNDYKGCITEKHWLSSVDGLPRQLGMCPDLDFLANPDGQEMWVKCWDFGYEVLTYSDRAPMLPPDVVSMHAAAVERRKERSAANGAVPVGQYLSEGIPKGQQSDELWRVSCALAARGFERREIEATLAEIIEVSEVDPAWPWDARYISSFARRAVQQFARAAMPALKQLKLPGKAEPEPDISAGSEISVLNEDLERTIQDARDVKKCFDLRKVDEQRFLDTVPRVEAKLRAEQDSHPRSLDWFEAPSRTMEVYEDLIDLGIESLKAGAEFARVQWVNEDGEVTLPIAQLNGPWREQLEWLLHGNGAPLIQYHGGLLCLLSDPWSPELPRYPGVPPDEEPKAGKSFGTRLDNLILIIRSCKGGDYLTQREVAEVINNPWFRQAFGLEEYRYISVSAMSQHHVKLRKRRTIWIIEKAVRYREKHRWHLESAARYGTCLSFAEGNELPPLVTRGIRTALEDDMDDLKRTVLSSPFEDAASAIDTDGPEFPMNLVQSRRGEARHSVA